MCVVSLLAHVCLEETTTSQTEDASEVRVAGVLPLRPSGSGKVVLTLRLERVCAVALVLGGASQEAAYIKMDMWVRPLMPSL